MSILNSKRLLIRTTGINTYRTISISTTCDFLNIAPLENKQLWQHNLSAFKQLFELAKEHGVVNDLSSFTSLLRQSLEEIREDRPIESSWDQLYRLIALAIHYYLLAYTETVTYKTNPEWFIGRNDEKHNWINDVNYTTRAIGQLLGQSPILFYSA
ncbi:hypothetical protein AUJ42_01145 [Candidatus Collierbacteria bacterium CG1_02_44_10]|uniref:Uncharacterized protein n=4 Tax=Candidatus Collieribacteriota TaxID=1752725 RepID=A0A2H0DTV3_9BACT|nr:hypothetical protein [bacterium]OIN91872.1 MAG: hypothetical protein AUJ42_01145 [Candidatus Collierbacteria bacterium CG1_02_44_10]PIP85603.1 MAG: hypothetical protein COW83_03405 [Candidatus Collierbacteria bacterium CG22_combo_CG10-13_8_21_14_all_43_12]PIR99592.1 MAG: hypothetical protein COT86_03065 [Candidatus Collierbacteria bacterium CG10_big_fil_rev_8_21_14_0_10_43_36]PIZ24816.1 MAG: hypothetical protein COY48_00865 [Candidatus Collierbacteria bacterium CG_4_10_14_0_8_um_filter_43_86